MKQIDRINRQCGFGIIETVIALGIMTIVGLGMMTMFDSQQKQIRYMQQKQDLVELRSIMQRQLSMTNVCTWQLRDKTFDAATNPSATVLNLLNNTLYAGPDAASSPIAAAGQFLPGTLNRVLVTGITFKEITATTNTNEYKGIFEVSFGASALGTTLYPVTVQQYFTATPVGASTNRRIVGCEVNAATGAGPGGVAFNASGNFVAPVSGVYKVTVVGGGGGGGAGVNQPTMANGAGGGGAGGTVIFWTTLVAGQAYPVQVGAGGFGAGAGYGGTGGTGLNSIFQTATANGGAGGGGSFSGSSYGGAGGSASGGPIIMSGGAGAPGGRAENAETPPPGMNWYAGQGGAGGSSFLGGGGSGGVGGGGMGGFAPGSGGGGGDAQNASGGSGANGMVIFEWGS